jgi:AraC family transcriptional activator of pobA
MLQHMSATAVPAFFLYGEPVRDADPRFLHLEPIEARSRPADWTIRAHAHRDLSQLLFVTKGGGRMAAEAETLAFEAPAMLVSPAGSVHGFAFEPETAGYVLTLSEAYVRELVVRAPETRGLFAACRAVGFEPQTFAQHRFVEHLEGLERELVWSAPGRGIALEGRLLCIVAGALRALVSPSDLSAVSPGAALVARFREAVEQRFRTRTSVEDYARALAVTPSRLRSACMAAAKASPSALVHARIMVEAKRLLLYTAMSIAEVGYDLGFEDPAYFARFFAERAGRSPSAFRAAAREPAAR